MVNLMPNNCLCAPTISLFRNYAKILAQLYMDRYGKVLAGGDVAGGLNLARGWAGPAGRRRGTLYGAVRHTML